MALREAQPEPSMEEILASIRRIISEEGEPQPADEPALDLTAEEPADDADDLLVFEDVVEDPVAAAFDAPPSASDWSTPSAPPAPAFEPAPAPSPASSDGLVSDPAAAAAAGAFTRLAGSLRLSDVQGQTVEGLIREMLRPMLREWLDSHLPKIVEAQVEAELNRISRMVR